MVGRSDRIEATHSEGRLRVFATEGYGSELTSLPFPKELFTRISDIEYQYAVEWDGRVFSIRFHNGYWFKFYDYWADVIPIEALAMISSLTPPVDTDRSKWSRDLYFDISKLHA
jgi:hypothetical protein